MPTRRPPAFRPFNGDSRLEDVRTWLWSKIDQPYGATCPTCTQHVQRYKRKITIGMCRDLVRMYRTHGESRYFFLPNALPRKANLEFTKLQHWGLIEGAAPRDKNPNSPGVGYWYITPKGGAFIRKEITVQQRVYVFNKESPGEVMSDPPVYIHEVLSSFLYDELMTGVLAE